jgi:hypothetical protein
MDNLPGNFFEGLLQQTSAPVRMRFHPIEGRAAMDDNGLCLKSPLTRRRCLSHSAASLALSGILP